MRNFEENEGYKILDHVQIGCTSFSIGHDPKVPCPMRHGKATATGTTALIVVITSRMKYLR